MSARRPSCLARGHRALGAAHLSVAVAAAAALALGGCGLGAGEQSAGVQLRVTDDFGAQVLSKPGPPKQAGADTVMRLLQRNAKVTTRYGGGFVQSIDGREGQADAGKQIDWFYYVNGVQAGRGAAAWRVGKNERIWWDRHRWELDSVGAVVGDYPEPMRSGSGGRWAGAQLDCASARTCDAVSERLSDDGASVTAGPARASGGRTRVIVGPWAAIRGRARELVQLQGGPAVSGVFVRLDAAGRAQPLDHAGTPAGPVSAGALVAALRTNDESPVWVVTGPDEAAVAGGVRALDTDVLAGSMAVLVDRGRARALPVRSGDAGREVEQ